MDKAGELMTTLPPERAARDMSGAVDFLLSYDAVTSDGVGVVGFCKGGMRTLVLAAQRGDVVRAAVPFYGLPDWSGLGAVVRGHMAGDDDFFGPDAARDLERRLRDAGKDVEFVVHDAGHAFMNEENALGTYDAALADRIWPDVVSFLRDTLG